MLAGWIGAGQRAGGQARRHHDPKKALPARRLAWRGRRRRRMTVAQVAVGITCLLAALHLLGPSLGTRLLGSPSTPASRSADLAKLLSLSGDLEPEDSAPRAPTAPSTPKLIPRILHQTYKSADVPQSARRLMLSWRTMNPGWDIRFYDDQVRMGC